MRTRALSGAGWLVAIALASASVEASAPKEKDLQQQQIDYAKSLYEQGVEAMEAKDYPRALQLFNEAYRYAPHLHLFNYNIGTAAELAGDCRQARIAYQRFVDLVTEHPELETVRAKLEELKETCAEDEETLETVKQEAVVRRETNREQEKAERALGEALAELRRTIDFYKKVLAAHPKAPVFKWTLWKKKRHAKRMVRLFRSHGIEVPKGGSYDGPVPDSVKGACAKAAGQEKRNARVFGEVLEMFDSREMYRVMSRFQRHAERRDRPRFEGCS